MSWCAPSSERNALFPLAALVAIVGTGGPFGPTKTLLFTADNESHGLFGTITALP